MLNKLLYFALPIAALAVMGVQTASADYYDCEGNVRPGTPGPSQCHYLTKPPAELPVQPEPTTESITPCANGNCGIYQFTPQFPQYTIIVPDDDEPEEIVPDDNEVTEIRNSRKYCVRDYCYIIYEICYSNGYCEKKAEKVDRNDMNDDNHDNNYYWGNQLNNYVYNYFYNNYYFGRNDNCDSGTRNCVYRGSHYGRYTNRYWDF
jgi:hypothetical protein